MKEQNKYTQALG